MRYVVLPYKQGSRSARALADALGGRVLRLRNSRYRARPGDVIINWGSSRTTDRVGEAEMRNAYSRIRWVSDKLKFFMLIRETDPDILPTFWIDNSEISENEYPVVCRTVLDGHSGAGIVIANSPDELVDAPLYVKYIKKQQEYRVHVGNPNTIIAVQRKARDRSVADEDVDWMVRNHKNGFNFVRNGFTAPEQVIDVAQRAIVATGLDFGAVDVVFNEREGRAYVLEINSAPGLEGQTVQDYVDYFTGEKDK